MNKTIMKAGWVLLAAAMLSACATKSDVRKDGTTETPVFPDPQSVTFNHDRGTFPTAHELENVKAGMTKDQLYKLLGRPHFSEGMFAVREWDYLFHFHTPGQGTDNVTTCQFKVIYDIKKYARSFHWQAVDPVEAVCPPSKANTQTQRFTLSADALFGFDKSGLDNIHASGKAKLDEFAEKVKHFDKLKAIRIIGHTDRLGDDNYNQALSERRAETVRRYLIERGVSAGVMNASGVGESQPIKACDAKLAHHILRDCLQDNRRVEVEVDGSGAL